LDADDNATAKPKGSLARFWLQSVAFYQSKFVRPSKPGKERGLASSRPGPNDFPASRELLAVLFYYRVGETEYGSGGLLALLSVALWALESLHYGLVGWAPCWFQSGCSSPERSGILWSGTQTNVAAASATTSSQRGTGVDEVESNVPKEGDVSFSSVDYAFHF